MPNPEDAALAAMNQVDELKTQLASLAAQLHEQTEARLAAVAAHRARRERELRARSVTFPQAGSDSDEGFDDRLVRELRVRARPPTP